MADILIRGMEIPKDWDLWLCIDTGGTVYNVKPVITGTAQEVGTAILLPEKHGRLIDADAVVKTICNSCDGACDVVQCDCLNCKADCRCDIVKEISDAPTIIEADLEWKMKNCCCFSNTDPAEGGTDDDGNA